VHWLIETDETEEAVMKARRILSILSVLLFVSACETASEKPEAGGGPTVGQPFQSECLEQAELALLSGGREEIGSVQIFVEGTTLTVVDYEAEFNCCLDAWMEVDIEDGAIDVVEREDPDKSMACFCTCPYTLSIEVSDLAPGSHAVRVYREETQGNKLLHQESVQVP